MPTEMVAVNVDGGAGLVGGQQCAAAAPDGYTLLAHNPKMCIRDRNIVIPAKRNRKHQRDYDRYLYRLRHLVENAFLHLKRWRGIATRYAKNTASFLAAVQIRCIAIWCAILA